MFINITYRHLKERFTTYIADEKILGTVRYLNKKKLAIRMSQLLINYLCLTGLGELSREHSMKVWAAC